MNEMNTLNNGMPEKADINSGKKRRLRMGSFSLIIMLAVIVAAVVVNLIVGTIPSEYRTFDLTGKGKYEISDETVKFLDALEEDVTIYFVTTSDTRDKTVSIFLERYSALSSHIKVEELDPDEDPAFVDEHNVQSINSLVVVGEKRSDTIDNSDIYEYSDDVLNEYYNNYYYFLMNGVSLEDAYSPDIFDADNEITSAIDYVTTDVIPVAYTLTGHGEIALGELFDNFFDSVNIMKRELSLLTAGEIPGDANVIIINNPSSDMTDAELETLTSYIDGGGSVVLVTDITSYSSEKLPNLTKLAAHCGMAPVEGVVLEGDENRYANGDKRLLVEPMLESKVTEEIENPTGYVVAISGSHAIKEAEGYEGTMTVSPIIETSSSAYVIGPKEAVRDKNDDDVTGTLMLGAISEDANTGAAFVWYGSSYINSGESSMLVGYNDLTLYGYSITAVCDRPATLVIDSVNVGQPAALLMTEGAGTALKIIIQYVIPIAVLAVGFAVWLRRRLR